MDFSVLGAAFIAALAVMLISLAGVVFSVGSLGGWMRRYTTYLATFSAGVFIVVAYHLASESVREGGWILAVVSVLIGAALMEGIHFIFPTKHHHHDTGHEHSHTPIEGRSVLFSDALHNIGDGILLVGAFAANWYIGIFATIGVLLHETVQEISEYFVLREAGYSNKSALTRNFAVSSTILIGFFLAGTLSSVEWILALLSGIAAGGFLSVILHDLLPHAIASAKTHGGAYIHIVAGIVGIGLMFGVQTILPHEESEDQEDAAIVTETEEQAAPIPAKTTEQKIETPKKSTTQATPKNDVTAPAGATSSPSASTTPTASPAAAETQSVPGRR